MFLIKGPHPLGGLREWGQKVKIQFFQNMVMMHIKLKGIWYAATWKQTFFQNIVMCELYIKLNGTTIAATW